MLSNQQKLARRLVRLRRAQSCLSERWPSRPVFNSPYLAQVEKAVRPISARCLRKLEQIYGKKLSVRLWKGIGRRGKPPLCAATRRPLSEFMKASGDPFGIVKTPKFPQAHQVQRTSDPLWPMALHLSIQAREEVELLEKLRAEDEQFWRQFNSLRFDSWSEKRLLVRLALLGSPLIGIRLDRLGCSLKVVDGRTGGKSGLHRGFILAGQEGWAVWCPQVAVSTQAGVFCVDNLLLVSSKGRQVTVAVEVNGRPFHQDKQKQRGRDRALGVPVLHLDAGELHKPGLITRILRWAYAQLPAA